MTTSDCGAEISSHRLGCVEAASIKLFDVCILNRPDNVTRIIGTIGFTNTFHGCTTHSTEAPTIDIALGIVGKTCYVASVETSEIELVEIATSHRNW